MHYNTFKYISAQTFYVALHFMPVLLLPFMERNTNMNVYKTEYQRQPKDWEALQFASSKLKAKEIFIG